MPPPSPCCPKNNTRSTNDHNNDSDFDENNCDSEKDPKSSLKDETLGLVKTILGPSLEGAVLRTLEFGKSLIQGANECDEEDTNNEKCAEKQPLECLPKEVEFLLDKNYKTRKGNNEKEKKKNECLSKHQQEGCQKQNACHKKLATLSKIRSLDSDLKQNPSCPEDIKKQLEALIQINKACPRKNMEFFGKKPPMEMTVMSSFCTYNNEAGIHRSSSCDIGVKNDCIESASKSKSCAKSRNSSKICQAPEFLSNALGPTLDVSIIDNLKFMRNILKNDKGKGEGPPPEPIKEDVHCQSPEVGMSCRIAELQKHIEELEQKEQCLLKQIEEEERQRLCKKKALEEEEKKICEKKAYLEALGEAKKMSTGKSLLGCNLEAKYENVQSKIACEEEKLAKLKCQYENFKRELAEAKCRKESLKRNKALLDAWDVFASRVCHTRLPSFSRAPSLERKQFNPQTPMAFHCCLPPLSPPECPDKCSGKENAECGKESQTNVRCKIKMGEILFPIQRDVTCGLHQMLKSCDCFSKMKIQPSEDNCQRRHISKKTCCTMGAESSTEIVVRTPCGEKPCRSKSDTSLKVQRCSKIVKVMWAVTRINIFQNNYRTYEVLEATSTPPSCVPTRTEGIFVVKTQRKPCLSPPRKKCSSKLGGH